MELNRQNILTIILVLTLLVGAYVWYAYFLPEPAGNSIGAKEGAVSKEFLAIAALLDKIKIDTEFFNDPAFLELTGGAKLPPPPLPENIGRTNPFAGF